MSISCYLGAQKEDAAKEVTRGNDEVGIGAVVVVVTGGAAPDLLVGRLRDSARTEEVLTRD